MSGSIEGLDDFKKFLDRVDTLTQFAIQEALQETGEKCVEDCQNNTLPAIDTGTLFDSWKMVQDDKQRGTNSITILSDPDVIATNPKHPNGDYYSPMIENGFIKPNGKLYRGQHMLKNAFSNCKRNLKANLRKELGSAFSNES